VRPKIYSKEGDEVAEPIDDVRKCTASHNVASSVVVIPRHQTVLWEISSQCNAPSTIHEASRIVSGARGSWP
jgi:hypothetical protein